MKLMIVESPNKCKKISQILGAGWIVKASVGHIRDLPSKELGVDVENRFNPSYVVSEGKQKVITDLKNAAAKSSEVWIATDLDREGEAIGYHLRVVLGLKDNYKRVAFDELTEAAIKKELSNPRKLDLPMVAAQETRRILDRLFGYIVSPELQKQSSVGMSAGRVQSPTVKLVVERDREVKAFIPKAHYGAEITLDNGLSLKLDTKSLQDEQGLILEASIVDLILSKLKSVQITVAESNPKNISPKPPFTTAELQQVASSKLDFMPDQTMGLAQKLFEEGRITYHRTDAPNLSDEAWQMIGDFLDSEGIAKSEERRTWNAKDKNAQEAHEGIRPSSMTDKPAGTEDKEKLYRLIYERSQAAVAADGIDLVTNVAGTDIDNPKSVFTTSGKVVQNQGWRDLITLETGETKDNELSYLPKMGDVAEVTEKERLDQKTKPPATFTVASLGKEMEKRGIGRPATYASIFSNMFRREYLSVKGKKIFSTSLGCAVVDALSSLEFMDYDYTSDLELQLDQIAQGNLKLFDVVNPAYHQLISDLPRIHIDQSQIQTHESENQESCPKCSKAIKRIRKKSNPKQFFWAHVGEPGECSQFIDDLRGKPYFDDLQTFNCPLCNGALERRYSSKNKSHFWVHKTESQCPNQFFDDKSGKPAIKDIAECPSCNHGVKRLKSKEKDKNSGKFSFFWVHINRAHTEGCKNSFPDEKGKPFLKEKV